MTIQEAIDRVDLLKPNHQSETHKVAWLAELDGLIHRELVMSHAHTREQETFVPYTMDTDRDTVLLAPFPYDEIYTYYLSAKVDLQNMEIGMYNNDKTLFNNAYDTLSDHWTRTHMPIGRREFRI